jgi:prepilin-type processing-associated H-X9-DG protein
VEVHRGRWPGSTHTVDPDPVTGRFTRAWIYTIAPYMEDVDAIRICPNDPHGDSRRAEKLTSFTMNGYLSKESRYGCDNIRKLLATSKTMVAFELADVKGVDTYTDHVHSFNWFSQSNLRKGLVFTAIKNEVQVDRHAGYGHYLFADGHVDLLSEDQIFQWSQQPLNFALPQ